MGPAGPNQAQIMPLTPDEGGPLHHRLNGHADSYSHQQEDKLSDIDYCLQEVEPTYANHQAVNAKDLQFICEACPVMSSSLAPVPQAAKIESCPHFQKNTQQVPLSDENTYTNCTFESAGIGILSVGSLFNLRGVGVTSHFRYIEDDEEDEIDDIYVTSKIGVNFCQVGRQEKSKSNFYHSGSPGEFQAFTGNRTKQNSYLINKDLDTVEPFQHFINQFAAQESQLNAIDKSDGDEYTDMSANMKMNVDMHLDCNGIESSDYGYGHNHNLTTKRQISGGDGQYGLIEEESELDTCIPVSSPPPLPPAGVPPMRLRKLRRSLSHRSCRENRRVTQENKWAIKSMGFGTELQSQKSHEALLRLQDAEIRLLECMKKCLSQRIKCDRDYALALTQMVNIAQKVEQTEFSSPIFQAWSVIISETSTLASLIRENTETLSSHTLERLVLLISEKKACRKHYAEERNRLENEVNKLQQEVTRTKAEYEKQFAKVASDKEKYEEVLAKGKTGSKLDAARNKYLQSTGKLHKAHNDYICALHEAKLQQQSFLRTTLPSLLEYQQEGQENMVQQSKDVLTEYSDMTNSSSDKFSSCHSKIQQKVSAIAPKTEYDDFLINNKSDAITPQKFEFDSNLLNEYKGKLEANKLAVNELTVDNVQLSKSLFMERMLACQENMGKKKKEVEVHEAEAARLAEKLDSLSMAERTQMSMHKRSCRSLKKEITELGCIEEKWQQLHDLFNNPLTQLGTDTPPPAVDFDDPTDTNNTSKLDTSQDDNTASSINTKFNTMKDNLKKKFKSRDTGNAPPQPPSKDFVNSPETNGEAMREGSLSSSTHSPKQPSSRDGYQEWDFVPEDVPKMAGPGKQLDEEEWYHGVLPRDEVQRLLVNNGDYLVRKSHNRKTGESQFVLSVFWNGHKHFIIQGSDGQWRFEGDSFNTIQELILQQHKSGTPVTKRSEAILHKAIVREAWELSNDSVELGMKIGNGNFGDVYRGKLSLDSQVLDVAVKTCRDKLSDDQKKKFLQEGRILKQYDHPNIVKLIGIAATKHPVMIVMEYVAGGSLVNYLRRHGASKTKGQLVRMCVDTAAGMTYLESKNCIHRDLAARNCLVGDDGVVKISDFGMSREEEEYTVSGGLKQIPIKWTAPEALHYARYTSACDVWSFGILMWEVFSNGKTPYPGLTNNQARDKIDEGYRMPPPDNTPPAIATLMSRCWETEANDRPKFDEILTDLKSIEKNL